MGAGAVGLKVAGGRHPATAAKATPWSTADIVAGRYDAGVRVGHRLARDMIAVRITDDLRMNVVASPNYLAQHPRPQTPQDLQAHNCIRLRFPSGAFLPWRFSIEGETLELDVRGSLTANDADLLVHVALNGTGVVYVLRDFAAPFIATGQLVPLLEKWMPPPSDGFFLYYPSKRQNLASLRAFIEFLLANLKKNAGSTNSVDAAMQSKRQ